MRLRVAVRGTGGGAGSGPGGSGAQMSSSRDFPFSFSSDVRGILGPPGASNLALAQAFPQLFDGSTARRLSYYPEGLLGSGVIARRQHGTIPAGMVVGAFTGHVFLGGEDRGDTIVALPGFRVNGSTLHLSVNASAQLGRFPSPTMAGAYTHSCDDANVKGEWWLDGPIPCLLARTTYPIPEGHRLLWDFNDHSISGDYALPLAMALSWRRFSGGAFRHCSCGMPAPCPLDRYLRGAEEPPSPRDSGSGSD